MKHFRRGDSEGIGGGGIGEGRVIGRKGTMNEH